MTIAIELSHISKKYPGTCALDEISFQVTQGSVHGFLGPNGAGKSTTMKIIVGLISSSSGELNFFGKGEQRVPIGYLPEVPPLYLTMQVEDYLRFIARINGEPEGKFVGDVMDKCGISSVRKRVINNLSKGYKQRVGIAAALVYDAKLIILDEPMAGLDPASIQEIRSLIQDLAGERTILFSSHQLHDVNMICDEVTIINQGRILQSAPLESLSKKFQSNQVFVIELERWNQDLENELSSQFKCESILSQAIGDNSLLRIFVSEQDDIRTGLSRFFVEKGCGLLGLKEEKIDLEEIFALSLKEEQQ